MVMYETTAGVNSALQNQRRAFQVSEWLHMSLSMSRPQAVMQEGRLKQAHNLQCWRHKRQSEARSMIEP